LKQSNKILAKKYEIMGKKIVAVAEKAYKTG